MKLRIFALVAGRKFPIKIILFYGSLGAELDKILNECIICSALAKYVE
jgi:hypothetical protein